MGCERCWAMEIAMIAGTGDWAEEYASFSCALRISAGFCYRNSYGMFYAAFCKCNEQIPFAVYHTLPDSEGNIASTFQGWSFVRNFRSASMKFSLCSEPGPGYPIFQWVTALHTAGVSDHQSVQLAGYLGLPCSESKFPPHNHKPWKQSQDGHCMS